MPQKLPTAKMVRKDVRTILASTPTLVDREWKNGDLFSQFIKPKAKANAAVTDLKIKLNGEYVGKFDDWKFLSSQAIESVGNILQIQGINDDSPKLATAAESQTVDSVTVAAFLREYTPKVFGEWKEKDGQNVFKMVRPDHDEKFPAANVSWTSPPETVVGLVSSLLKVDRPKKPDSSNSCERTMAKGICVSKKGKTDDYKLLATFKFQNKSKIESAKLQIISCSDNKAKLKTYVEVELVVGQEPIAHICRYADGKPIGGPMTKS